MKIKSFTPSDVNAVVTLLRLCYPTKKITPASFLWKHFDPSFQQKTVCKLALQENKITSLACFTPLTICKQGQDEHFYSCAIVATDPEFRRQGLVTQLTQEIERILGPNTNYLGFSNEQGVKIDQHSKKINYHIVGKFCRCYLFPFPFLSYDIEKVEQINPEFLTNWQTSFFEIKPSVEYIDWKFQRNPRVTFYYLKILKNEKELGYIIYQKNALRVNIVKILIKPEELNPKLFYKLAFYFLFHERKISCIRFLPNAFWKSVLPKLKLQLPIQVYFTIKTPKTKMLTAENWLLQGGDIQ